MLRIVIISSLFAAACDVGEVPGAIESDGGGGDGGDMNAVCVDTVTPAPAPHAHTAGGTSNAGQACQALGCHAAGGAGGEFSFSGTVYTDTAGTTAKAGATVKVISNGMTIVAVSDTDGNFYSTQTISLPANTQASACPTLAPMVGQIVTGGGNCNSCHATGGSTAPIYVQ